MHLSYGRLDKVREFWCLQAMIARNIQYQTSKCSYVNIRIFNPKIVSSEFKKQKISQTVEIGS